MEERLIESELFGKCGVLWLQLAAKIYDFHLHLVVEMYKDSATAAGKAECWTVVLTIVIFICWDIRKM